MSRRSLAGRRALLTGAAGGVGAALARRLARAGVTLVLTDRRGDPLLAAARALPPSAVAATIQADLAAPEGLDALAAHPSLRRLDVLIHNAGVAPGAAFASQPEAAIHAALDVNLRAVLLLTRRLLPGLLRRPRPAVAIVASGAGLVAPGGLAAYAASKAGLVAFAQALRTEHGRRLPVSVVCPAFVRTDIVAHTAAQLGGQLGGQPLDGQPPAQEAAVAGAARPSSSGASRAEASVAGASPGSASGGLAPLHDLVQRLGVSPDRVASAVMHALRHRQRCVPVGVLTRAVLAAHALSPGLVERVGHQVFRILLDRGVLR